MFDLDAFIANKDLILKDRDNRADVQKVLSVYAEKVDDDYVVKAKWSDIFDALLQGMKVQAQVITFTEGSGTKGVVTPASAVVETYDLYDAGVTADGFNVNGTDLSASSADAYPVGSLSRPSSGGGGEGGVLVCTVDGDTVALDHTWQEIKDAGYAVVDSIDGTDVICPTVQIADNGDDGYAVVFLNISMSSLLIFVAQTADDYPVMVSDDNGGGDSV